ncbi:(-)-alpha-terpineol synthase [Handroanthus impetiginosus]|uniref:(-)-alpha-terpineol synthase n=1 Tax=Handroanthus impetiginosus TaxID=429701 RepID=A0A2G9HSG2_9LAMI|nr:(-)-alpha-terpineol synthase [Handroanthus impetiginosus]
MATRIMHVPMPRKRSNYLHTKAFEKGYVYSKKSSINVKPCSTLCSAEKPTDRKPIERRRSGNYKPPSWDFDYIQSLNSEYKGEKYLRRVFELKKRVKMMLEGVMDRVDQLEFIDDLQKLGILYHFEDKIKRILENIYHDHISSKNDKMKETNLYSTALEYRLLRQHGFCVSEGHYPNLRYYINSLFRWDIKSMEQLPHYMQVMFLALNNLINEIAYDVLKDQGIVIIPYLRKLWADLSQSYFQEAKWHYEIYKPTLQEYVENGWISISAPVILCHAFLLLANPIEIEVVQSLFKYHNVVRLAGIILRLVNDLGTSPDEMKRGDVLKSVQCYMNETGACEEEAREYIRFLIGEAWKEMNRERVAESSFPHEFIRSAVNLGRTAQYMYHYGDGHGHQQHPEIKDQFRRLLFEPIA